MTGTISQSYLSSWKFKAKARPIKVLLTLFLCRELDLGVFATLHYSPLSRTLVDSEDHTREREELALRPPQLLFLLQDLSSKLSRTFSAFGAKVSHVTVM